MTLQVTSTAPDGQTSTAFLPAVACNWGWGLK
jgi:hypothetical protein